MEIGKLETRTAGLDRLKEGFNELKPRFELMWKDFRKRKKL